MSAQRLMILLPPSRDELEPERRRVHEALLITHRGLPEGDAQRYREGRWRVGDEAQWPASAGLHVFEGQILVLRAERHAADQRALFHLRGTWRLPSIHELLALETCGECWPDRTRIDTPIVLPPDSSEG